MRATSASVWMYLPIAAVVTGGWAFVDRSAEMEERWSMKLKQRSERKGGTVG